MSEDTIEYLEGIDFDNIRTNGDREMSVSCDDLENIYSLAIKAYETMPIPPKYHKKDVIDESKSVLWNREQIEKLKDERELAKRTRKAMFELFERTYKTEIMGDKLDVPKYERIYDLAWDEYHKKGINKVCKTF